MKQKLTVICCLTLLLIALSGCNGKSNMISANIGDDQEIQAVRFYTLAMGNYRFRLNALLDRYKKDGNMQKLTWARRELNNLDQTGKVVVFEGFGALKTPDANSLAETDEPLLVELVVTARADYLSAGDKLMTLYDKRQDTDKASMIGAVLDEFDPVRTYRYFLSAEIPAQTLRAAQEIAKADEAFDAALKLYKSANSLLAKFGSNTTVQRREALAGFRGLVLGNPTSNKIGRSAYYVAEIYRHFGESARAAVWYDRAWQWDTNLIEPARYRAATLYDYDTNVRDATKARQYYNMAIQFEQAYPRNVDSAKKRIRALSQ